MSPVAITVLALVMSVDAFAAALSRGATGQRVHMGDALRTGAVFGVVETLTPVLGWSLGILAAGQIAAIDHWVAFTLLGLVGLHCLYAALRRAPDAPPRSRSPWMLVAIAVGTSIDAMAVGVSLAVLEVDIWIVAPAIGLATFIMATGGMMAGRMLGSRFGRGAEALAGLALIALGTSILLEHLVG